MRLTRIVTTAVLAVGTPAAAYGGLSWGSTPSSSGSPTAVVQSGDAAAFVECMRNQGLSDFPDVAVVDGRVVLDLDGTSIDPFSDAYRDAVTACEGELPEGVELPADPEPPTPATPPSPEDGEMPPVGPEAPAAPSPPD